MVNPINLFKFENFLGGRHNDTLAELSSCVTYFTCVLTNNILEGIIKYRNRSTVTGLEKGK